MSNIRTVNTTKTAAADGSTVVFAANSKRVRLTIAAKTNASTDSPEVIVFSTDGSNASATSGTPMDPGDIVIIDNPSTAEVRCWSSGGAGTLMASEDIY